MQKLISGIICVENLLHPLCCSPEQEESISRLNANVDLIRRSCPSCLVNVKRLFCNLFCAPNQKDFVRVERVKGDTVMEVTYAISDHFAIDFFASCQDVRVFGAYLLDYEYGCGKLKRANCTAIDFMQILGSSTEIPLNFHPLIINQYADNKDQWPRYVMNDTAYQCDQAPPNHSTCQCDHCPKVCNNNHLKTNGGHKARHYSPTTRYSSYTSISSTMAQGASGCLQSSIVIIITITLLTVTHHNL